MRHLAACLVLLFGAPLSARAETPVEIGATLGMTLVMPSGGGDTQVVLSVPSGTFLGLSSMYMSVISGGNWMIEPQVLFIYNSEADDVLFSGMLQLGYLFTPQGSSSIYLAGHVGYFHLSSDDTSPALGVALGTRKKIIGGAAAVRGEIRYRRYTDDAFDLGEVAFNVGLGVVL